MQMLSFGDWKTSNFQVNEIGVDFEDDEDDEEIEFILEIILPHESEIPPFGDCAAKPLILRDGLKTVLSEKKCYISSMSVSKKGITITFEEGNPPHWNPRKFK